METVMGRNGYEYDAKHISGNFYRVGRQVVVVKSGKVVRNATADEKQDAIQAAEDREFDMDANYNRIWG